MHRVGIVGAGIIGSCCAAELASRGYQVTLFDRAMPGTSGASRGNASHIAAPEVTPLASPDIFLKAFGMMRGAYAPLRIPFTQWLRLSPWLLNFIRNSHPRTYDKHVKELGTLNRSVWDDTRALYQRADLLNYISEIGALYLFESEQSFKKSKKHFDLFKRECFNSSTLNKDEIMDLEPALAPIFYRGYHLPEWGQVKNPHKVVLGMLDYAYSQQAQFKCETVHDISTKDNKTNITCLNGGTFEFEHVIVSAGVWSKQLTAPLENEIMLDAERGYNITYQQPNAQIEHPIIFGDRGVVATQIDEGLRIGGWTELGGTKRPAQQSFFQRMDEVAQQVFPNLNTKEHYQWMGHRPSTPSSTPIIRHSKDSQRIIYAFGHGHLGLTQAPTTARMVAELLAA